MKHTILVFCTALALFATLAPAAPAWAQSAKSTKATDPAISKISSAYQAATNAKDVAKLMALYADDAVEMPPNQPMVQGKGAIEAYYKKQFADGDPTLMLKPIESSVSSNFAFEAGSYTQTLKVKANGQTINDKGKYVVLLKQGSDRLWHVEYAIYNSDNPPMLPPASGTPPAAAKPTK